jgi:hypothetical protein
MYTFTGTYLVDYVSVFESLVGYLALLSCIRVAHTTCLSCEHLLTWCSSCWCHWPTPQLSHTFFKNSLLRASLRRTCLICTSTFKTRVFLLKCTSYSLLVFYCQPVLLQFTSSFLSFLVFFLLHRLCLVPTPNLLYKQALPKQTD